MVRFHAESPSCLPPMDYLPQPQWYQAALSSGPGIELLKEIDKRLDELEKEVGGVIVGRDDTEIATQLVSTAQSRIAGRWRSAFRWNSSSATRCAQEGLNILMSNPAYLHQIGYLSK